VLARVVCLSKRGVIFRRACCVLHVESNYTCLQSFLSTHAKHLVNACWASSTWSQWTCWPTCSQLCWPTRSRTCWPTYSRTCCPTYLRTVGRHVREHVGQHVREHVGQHIRGHVGHHVRKHVGQHAREQLVASQSQKGSMDPTKHWHVSDEADVVRLYKEKRWFGVPHLVNFNKPSKRFRESSRPSSWSLRMFTYYLPVRVQVRQLVDSDNTDTEYMVISWFWMILKESNTPNSRGVGGFARVVSTHFWVVLEFFGVHTGVILGSPWTYFGIIIGSLWDDFGLPWDHSGVILKYSWNIFTIILGPFWNSFGEQTNIVLKWYALPVHLPRQVSLKIWPSRSIFNFGNCGILDFDIFFAEFQCTGAT